MSHAHQSHGGPDYRFIVSEVPGFVSTFCPLCGRLLYVSTGTEKDGGVLVTEAGKRPCDMAGGPEGQSPQRSRLARLYWGPGEKDKLYREMQAFIEFARDNPTLDHDHQGETGNKVVDPERCVRCRLETFR